MILRRAQFGICGALFESGVALLDLRLGACRKYVYNRF
jgi:hypothetical protein